MLKIKEIKKIVAEEFKNNLDSTRIFAYVSNLEQKINKAIEYINSEMFDYMETPDLLEILGGKE